MAYELSSASRSPHDTPTTMKHAASAFDRISAVDVSTLPDAVEQHGAQTIHHLVDTELSGYEEYYGDLVVNGHEDLKAALENYLTRASGADKDPRMKLDRQLGFITHDKTVRSLGILAARSESAMRSIIDLSRGAARPHDPQLIYVNDELAPHLTTRNMDPGLEPASRCPYASADRHSMPTPLFRRFVEFSGRLIILEEMRRRRETLPR